MSQRGAPLQINGYILAPRNTSTIPNNLQPPLIQCLNRQPKFLIYKYYHVFKDFFAHNFEGKQNIAAKFMADGK